MTIPFQTEWNDLIPFQLEWNGHSIPDGMAIPIRPDWNATLLIILRNMPPGPVRRFFRSKCHTPGDFQDFHSHQSLQKLFGDPPGSPKPQKKL